MPFERTFVRGEGGAAEENLHDLVEREGEGEETPSIHRQALHEGHAEKTIRCTTTDGRRTFRLRVARALDPETPETYSVYTDITEQQKRERTLRLFRQIVEQANDAIIVTEVRPLDEPGPRIEYVNPAFEAVSGYSEEEIRGKTPRILQGPETDRAVLDTLREALENGESWSGSTVNYRKDGEPYHLAWSVAPVRNDDGEIEHWVSVQRDVTRQRRREKVLREQEARLRGLMNSVPGVVFRAYARPGREYGFYRVSEHAEDLLGISREPSDFFERCMRRVPASSRKELRQAIDAAVDAEERIEFETPFVRPSGETIWILGTATPEPRADEIVYNGVILDITERKRREQELREAQSRMELTLRHTGAVVFEIDLETREVSRHGGFEDFFAAAPGELPTWDVFAERAVHPADQAAFRAFYRRLEEGEQESGILEYRTRPDTGEVRWIRDIVSVVEGQPRRLRGLAQDVTEQKERTRALRAAKEEAEEASRLKSTMLANMSHEFRTPLTSIVGFSELLKDRLSGSLEVFASRIHSSSKRLHRTLESVLRLSELEAGATDLERQEVDLGQVVKDACETVEGHAAEKSLAVETDVAAPPAVGYWNRDAVYRICRNLLENAVKFTPEGGRVHLRVRTDDRHAILEIEDTGIGMDPENVPALFEAFKQESEGLDREYEGSGLGLSIVKRLTEELGGAIDVETEKGEGTCFTVYLPWNRGDEEAPEEA